MIMRIKELREAAGMKQADLANQMGALVTSVSNWETEVALPKARDLPLLAKVLNCSISELFVSEENAAETA